MKQTQALPVVGVPGAPNGTFSSHNVPPNNTVNRFDQYDQHTVEEQLRAAEYAEVCIIPALKKQKRISALRKREIIIKKKKEAQRRARGFFLHRTCYT